MEDIYENEEYEDDFTTFGEDQSLDLNETQYQSIIDGLRQQCATTSPQPTTKQLRNGYQTLRNTISKRF